MSGAGDLVRDAEGTAVPSQRLRTGELAFLASAVPGLGAKRYTIGAGRGPAAGPARVGDNGLSCGPLTAVIDPASGDVKSLRWTDGAVRELVDPGGLPAWPIIFMFPGSTRPRPGRFRRSASGPASRGRSSHRSLPNRMRPGQASRPRIPGRRGASAPRRRRDHR